MKTLLVAINAKYIHSNPAVYSLQKSCRQYSRQFGIELGEVLVIHDSGADGFSMGYK